MQKIVISKQFTLNLRDFAIALILAVVTSVLSALYDMVVSGEEIDYRKLGGVALATVIAYLGKNFSRTPRVTAITKTNLDADKLKDALDEK